MSPFSLLQPTTGKSGTSFPLFVLFAYLQLLDLLTTLAFLAGGVEEANPLVRCFMAAVGSPVAGLVLLKIAALAGAVFCCRSGRTRLLVRANVFFAALVVWNLAALLVMMRT